MAQARQ